MDSIDDDFGELYADVEVQASSAMGALDIEPEDNESPAINGSKSAGDDDDDDDEKFVVDSAVEDSDSEDDLNIVLDDHDCEKFLVTGARSHGGGFEEDEDGAFGVEGTESDKILKRVEPVEDGSELNSTGTGAKRGFNSHFKYVRPRGSSFPNNMKVNGYTSVSTFSSLLTRGEREGDFYSQKKGKSLVLVASRRNTPNSLPHKSGYGFSLPWFRTILDVDIDAFEEKPWRHPGVDISDFFNFGFNEDSWKQYCISLENLRQQSSKQARNAYYSSKSDQAYEAEAGHGPATQEAMTEKVAAVKLSFKCADRGEMLYELPKGRAIQVEESIIERQPSMDLRHPCFQDSDVIIQIALLDSTVDPCVCAKEEQGHGSKCEVSESVKLDPENDRNVCFSISSSSDVSSGEHYARIRNVSTSSSSGRSLQPTTGSDQTSLETNDHGKDKFSDMNGGCNPNMDVCISEGISEGIKTKDKGNKVACIYTYDSDTCSIETEPSSDNQSHFNPTFSFSASSSEERSEDSFNGASIEVSSPLRRQPLDCGTELQKSVASYHKSSRSDDCQSDGGEDYLMHESPVRDKQKHERRRHQQYEKQRILLESDVDPSQISDAEGDCKRYRRHRYTVEGEWKHDHGRPRAITDRKMYPENYYEAFPLSNAGEHCDKDYSSVHCGRREVRSQDLGYHDIEGSSYYREREPCHNGSKSCADNHMSFKEDSNQFVRKNWNGRELYHERRAGIDKENDMDGFWHHGQRPAQRGFIPRTYGESRRFVSSYSAASKEKDIRWRKGNGILQFHNKIDHDDCLLDYEHEHEWLKEKHGRSIPFTYCERDMVEPYERCLPPITREFKSSGRKGRYLDVAYFHSERSWPMEGADQYQRRTHSGSLALGNDREPSTPNGRRWYSTVSSRNEAYDCKLIERYNRHQRIPCNEEDRESGWFGCYDYDDDNEDGILQEYSQVQSWRRDHTKRSRVPHWRGDKPRVKDRLFAQEVSFSREKTTNHDLIHAPCGSLQDETLFTVLKLEHHRHQMMSGGSNANCLKRNSNTRYKDEHEQNVLKDMDSVDLIIGEGKSSGRHSDGRSLICNARLGQTGLKFPMDQKCLRDFNDSCGSKAVKTDLPNTDGSRNDEKQLGKFSITNSNQDLDIEEGQIICEEQSIEHINPEKENSSEIMMRRGKVKMRIAHVDNVSVKNTGKGEYYDKKRILETLAKMERRRERFKDPITIKQEPEKVSEPQVELVVDCNHIKQQRPARKRQWGVR